MSRGRFLEAEAEAEVAATVEDGEEEEEEEDDKEEEEEEEASASVFPALLSGRSLSSPLPPTPASPSPCCWS